MNQDYKAYIFKKQLINTINQCGLSPTIILYILKQLADEIIQQKKINIQKQLLQQKQQDKEIGP